MKASFKSIKAGIGIAFMVAISSCAKNGQPVVAETIPPPEVVLATPPAANGQPVSVSIDLNKPGYTISDNFAGFSYENSYPAKDPTFLNANNTVLIQLMKNLGNGMIRFGGSSSNWSDWTGKPRTSEVGTGSLTTTDVDQMAAFLKALGWKAIFGLNFGQYNPTVETSRAVYVSKAFGNSLYAFQFGNEVNSFGTEEKRTVPYTYENYEAEWIGYRDAVRAALPDAPLAGPDANKISQYGWTDALGTNQKNYLKLITFHYYGGGPPATASFETITAPERYSFVKTALDKNEALVSKNGLRYRITEAGTVFNGGKAGLSEVFASGIWALDFLWQAASSNAQGVDFHGSATSLYTPIARDNKVITPRATYYAMLAFKYGGGAGATIVPATLTANNYKCTAYACTNNGKTYVTLVNRDVTDLSYTINVGNNPKSMKMAKLTAPSFDAKTGITFGGSSVNADGTFSPAEPEKYTTANGITVNVPARAAVVVTLE